MANGSDAPSRRVLTLAAAALVPLLLAAPIVWMQLRHAAELRASESGLRDEIRRVDGTIVEVKDLARVNAEYLARHQVLAELNLHRPAIARLFAAFQTLPKSLRMESVAARGSDVTLIGTTADPLAPAAAVAALESAGLEHVVLVGAGSEQGVASGERFEIRARLRGLAQGAALPGAAASGARPDAEPRR